MFRTIIALIVGLAASFLTAFINHSFNGASLLVLLATTIIAYLLMRPCDKTEDAPDEHSIIGDRVSEDKRWPNE